MTTISYLRIALLAYLRFSFYFLSRYEMILETATDQVS